MARESKKDTSRFNWRLMLGLTGLGVVCVSTAMAGFKVRQYVFTDPQFTLSHDRKDALTIQGLNYASRSKVQRIFAADFDRSVFAVPLGERRRRLLAIDWVEDASISRIWPDRLVVRIAERKPIAFVFSGIREDEPEDRRREHVRTFLRVLEELGFLAKDISEVDAYDSDNIRMVTQVDNRAVALTMGDGNFARRYQSFLNHYPEIRKRSPDARAFDLRLDDRITVKE
jgi:cell division protein FtsQ